MALASCSTFDATECAGSGATSAAVARTESSEEPFEVDRVVHGDTVCVLIDGSSTSVCLIWIDTPETKDPRKPVQCFGEQASARAHELLDDKRVWLEFDPTRGEMAGTAACWRTSG
ncbi:thermonuclease family protein [Cellulosimicrobium terreum]|nr:thermonuclease family protein [Cellulosimicrobium terreum]